MKRTLLLIVLTSLALTACAYYPDAGAQTQDSPWHGPVTDNGIDAFKQFMAGYPTPAQFRARYPDVQLVLPGDMATKELRSDNSRYFAQLNQDGRIVSGKFM